MPLRSAYRAAIWDFRGETLRSPVNNQDGNGGSCCPGVRFIFTVLLFHLVQQNRYNTATRNWKALLP